MACLGLGVRSGPVGFHEEGWRSRLRQSTKQHCGDQGIQKSRAHQNARKASRASLHLIADKLEASAIHKDQKPKREFFLARSDPIDSRA
jgi:hypothetical protein